MIRLADRAAAAAVNVFGPWLLFVVILVAGALAGLGWHFWPRWLPRRGGLAALAAAIRRAVAGIAGMVRALHPSRWRRHRRSGTDTDDTEDADEPEPDDDVLPDRTAGEFADLADRYAAAGRYAEAVRERLRAIVRDLVDRGIVGHHPDWTVTELVAAAAATTPAMGVPLGEAGRIFSDIWYGQRPAGAAHDERMRALAAQVAAAVTAAGAAGLAGVA